MNDLSGLKESSIPLTVFSICFVAALALSGTSAAAETHIITAKSNLTWESDGNHSKTDGTPLEVKVKTGDIIQITVPNGGHGFVTITGPAKQDQTEARDLVQTCGQSNEDAVLREIECKNPPDGFFGKNSNVGFMGTLKLQVIDMNADVFFWCTVHKEIMWGILEPTK